MPNYPIHTIASAPEKSKSALEQLQQAFGVIPNIAAVIANSPKLIDSLVGVFQQVHSSSLTEPEIQIVLLTDAVANSCTYAVAFHTALALQQGVQFRRDRRDSRAACADGPAICRTFHPGEDAHRETRAPERAGTRFVHRCRLHEGTGPGGYRHRGSLDDHQLRWNHRQSAAGRSVPAVRLARIRAESDPGESGSCGSPI